ncbi:UNVERIFIED_ORG: hypothetical protein GGI66_003627 [Rhizobium esperanzae]
MPQPHKLSDLRAKQKALKAEADGIFAAAEKTAEFTTAQDERLAAIKGEISALDTEIDAAIVELDPPPAPPNNAGAADGDVVAERKRASDILAACKMVGKPDKAAEFIAGGKSLSEVVDLLQSARANESDKNTINARHSGRQTDMNVAASWDDAVKKANALLGIRG